MQIVIIVFLLVVIAFLLRWSLGLKKEIKGHYLLEHELQYEAEHDSLTGLANGLLFIDRLSQSIKNASRFNKKIAILYLGLDNFTSLNNSYSTKIGDLILIEMAKKLKSVLRESDTVARLGGDEFIIILDHFEDSVYIHSVVEKVMKISQRPLRIEENNIKATFSLGISVYPDDNVDSKIILENASFAMRKVKESGRDSYQFYTKKFAEQAQTRKKLENELLDSLNKGQIEVYYQLQVDVQNSSITGMEALVRWNHPTLGLLLPDKFIPLAEEIDFIYALEDWVMKTSIAQFEFWRKQGFNTGKLSLNLSTQRLKKAYFIQTIGELINKNPSLGKYLCFEVPEKQIMHSPEEFSPFIQKLSRLGIKVTLDKFGLGCSSLLSLKNLGIDELKLDPFVLENKEVSLALICIAKNLKLPLSASGVQSKEQRDFLNKQGCNLMQGNLYHKPSSSNAIHSILKSKMTS